jgi:hypothetical protein
MGFDLGQDIVPVVLLSALSSRSTLSDGKTMIRERFLPTEAGNSRREVAGREWGEWVRGRWPVVQGLAVACFGCVSFLSTAMGGWNDKPA